MLIISSFWSSSQQWSQPGGEPIRRRAYQKESLSQGVSNSRHTTAVTLQFICPNSYSERCNWPHDSFQISPFSQAHVTRKNEEDSVVQNCSQGELTLTKGQLTHSSLNREPSLWGKKEWRQPATDALWHLPKTTNFVDQIVFIQWGDFYHKACGC